MACLAARLLLVALCAVAAVRGMNMEGITFGDTHTGGQGMNEDFVVEGSWGADYTNMFHRDHTPGVATMRLRATCTIVETGQQIECVAPHHNRSLLSGTGTFVGQVAYKRMRDGCSPMPNVGKKKKKGKKSKKNKKNGEAGGDGNEGPAMIAVVPYAKAYEGGKCTLAAKASMAKKAGYVGLIVAGGRGYAMRGGGFSGAGARHEKFKLPVALIDDDDANALKTATGQGLTVRLEMKMVKVENGRVIKDAGRLYAEGLALYKGKKFGEARARLWYAAHMEPDFYPAQLTLANAIMEQQCAAHACPHDGFNYHDIAKVPPELRAELEGRLAHVYGGRSFVEAPSAAVYADRCATGGERVVGAAGKGSRLHLVTVATRERPELADLRVAASELGLTLVVLGLGGDFYGHGVKMNYVRKYLSSEDVDEDDYILYIDAFDTMLLEPAKRILRAFLAMCAPIVFGAERRCNPDSAVRQLYPPPPPKAATFPYLNAGQYIGRVGDVQLMFDTIYADLDRHFSFMGKMYPPGRCDDQRWITRYMLQHPDRVAMDNEAKIFHTLDGVEAAQLEPVPGTPGALHSKLAGTRPALIHGQGVYAKPAFKALVKLVKASGMLDQDDFE